MVAALERVWDHRSNEVLVSCGDVSRNGKNEPGRLSRLRQFIRIAAFS
jgi:hypothetical protein